MGVLPSKNVTKPVAVPVAAVTVAVKVTVSPSVIVADEGLTLVLVAVEDGMYPPTKTGTRQTAAIRTITKKRAYLRESWPAMRITFRKTESAIWYLLNSIYN